MKAIILAAGEGNRIKEITDGKPKGFLKILGKPIIQHQIDTLKKAGIEDITIITGYQSNLFKQFADQGVRLQYNPFYRTTNVMGSFWFARGLLNEPFIFMHGDTFFEPDILAALLHTKGNALAVEFKECGGEEMKVKVRNNFLIEISKEMTESDGEFIGVAKIEDFEEVKSKLDELIEHYYNSFFERIITGMLDLNILFSTVDVGDSIWEEVDFKEDYESLVQRLKKKYGSDVHKGKSSQKVQDN